MSYLVGAVCAAGIYTCYILSGLVQEGIYTTGNKAENDTFTYPIFLVFGMSFGSMMTAFMVLLVSNSFDFKRTFAPLFQGLKQKGSTQMNLEKPKFNTEILLDFFLIAVTYIGAMLSSNYALTQVNYPTQVLVKSAKMVPVVIGGLILFRKTYPWYDYLGVFLVTSSLVAFNLAKMKTKAEAAQTMLGVGLCFASLLCDGMTGPRQDKMNSKYVLRPMDHMFFTNLFAMVPSAIAMIAVEGWNSWQYCERYPEVVRYIFLFCLFNTGGQIFIFNALTHFGALHLALITTTRKFFTVLASVLYFGHHMNAVQWTAVTTIFGSLIMQSYFSQRDKAKKKALEKKHDTQVAATKDGFSKMPIMPEGGARHRQ